MGRAPSRFRDLALLLVQIARLHETKLEMYMERTVAEKVNSILRSVTREIDDSIREVMNSSTQEEFQSYRRVAGKFMGEIFVEILQPIYDQYPDLTPKELRFPRK